MNPRSLKPRVRRKLGHYVYLYINPLDGRVFYVGKGKGNRALTHLQRSKNSDVAETLAELEKANLAPRIEILAHGLADNSTAYRVEAATIDLLELDNLANRVRGHHSLQNGRMPLSELVSIYEAERIEITEPSLLIRINRTYRPGMSPHDLYDSTRGVWKIGKNREKVELAFAVFEGIVREVYRITHWLPAGSTFSSRDAQGVQRPGRWEFVGVVAEDEVRGKYRNGDVSHEFPKSSQSPFMYLNI